MKPSEEQSPATRPPNYTEGNNQEEILQTDQQRRDWFAGTRINCYGAGFRTTEKAQHLVIMGDDVGWFISAPTIRG